MMIRARRASDIMTYHSQPPSLLHEASGVLPVSASAARASNLTSTSQHRLSEQTEDSMMVAAAFAS